MPGGGSRRGRRAGSDVRRGGRPWRSDRGQGRVPEPGPAGPESGADNNLLGVLREAKLAVIRQLRNSGELTASDELGDPDTGGVITPRLLQAVTLRAIKDSRYNLTPAHRELMVIDSLISAMSDDPKLKRLGHSSLIEADRANLGREVLAQRLLTGADDDGTVNVRVVLALVKQAVTELGLTAGTPPADVAAAARLTLDQQPPAHAQPAGQDAEQPQGQSPKPESEKRNGEGE